MAYDRDIPECPRCEQDIAPGDDTHPTRDGPVHADCCVCWTFPHAGDVAPRQDQTLPTPDQGALL